MFLSRFSHFSSPHTIKNVHSKHKTGKAWYTAHFLQKITVLGFIFGACLCLSLVYHVLANSLCMQSHHDYVSSAYSWWNLSLGISSFSSKVYVQPNKDHQNKYSWYTEHVRYVLILNGGDNFWACYLCMKPAGHIKIALLVTCMFHHSVLYFVYLLHLKLYTSLKYISYNECITWLLRPRNVQTCTVQMAKLGDWVVSPSLLVNFGMYKVRKMANHGQEERRQQSCTIQWLCQLTTCNKWCRHSTWPCPSGHCYCSVMPVLFYLRCTVVSFVSSNHQSMHTG